MTYPPSPEGVSLAHEFEAEVHLHRRWEEAVVPEGLGWYNVPVVKVDSRESSIASHAHLQLEVRAMARGPHALVLHPFLPNPVALPPPPRLPESSSSSAYLK